MKIFGTDGIRGKAGEGYIVPEFIIKLTGAISLAGNIQTKRIIIGKDTRLSCYAIENALVAGLTAHGFEVILTGPIPTPAVSMLTRSLRADYGIMISASHNPYYDNGIKIFDNNGLKISETTEAVIEKHITNNTPIQYKIDHNFGRARRLDDVIGRYVEYVKSSIPADEKFLGMKVLLDTANGSAYKIAPEILWELGCHVKTYNDVPDGLNINEGCGAVHPEFLASKIKEEGADIGIVLDGDGDRVIIIDENGRILDGDYIIAAITTYLRDRKIFENSGVVVTTMSNLGFENYMRSIGITDIIRTNVGDKYVMHKLLETGYKIGGEQSGHIIMPKYSSTGDGILSAIQVISAMRHQKWKASDIGNLFTRVPQIIHNVINKTITNEKMMELSVTHTNTQIRTIVRRSGTEHDKIRIMVEGSGDINSVARAIEAQMK